MSESWKNICWVIRKWVIEISINIKGKSVLVSFPWDPSFRHLFLSPNLLQLPCTFDILFKCFFIVIVVIIEECMLWTIKWFPSTATALLCQPLCISSRHYASLDQWCRLVGRVASNAIMCHLDVMRCKQVLGLVPWFWCIVSLLPASIYLPLVNMVGLVNVEGGREGQLGCTYDWFWGEALADRNLTVGGDCSMTEWSCSSMVLYELMMAALGSCQCTQMKMLTMKCWLM